MDRKILVGIAVLSIIIALIISYYFQQTREQLSQKRIVVYAYNDKVTGIDPSIEDDTGLVVLGAIYETLTYYDARTGEVKPRLAINWTSSQDGTEWIFYLRRDVVFHDGTRFNATAVKISVERARDIYLLTGRGLGYIWDAVEEIEIIDEYTVKFKLSSPRRLDILASAAYAAYIFSPSVLEKSGAESYISRELEKWFNSGNAIGTGPYRLEYYDPVREIKLVKFESWWGWKEINNPEAPDIVIIKIVTEPLSQYNGLLSGEIDIACSVPRGNIIDLMSRGFRVINMSTYHNFILFFNTKRYPTNITEFRLAVAHGMDLDRIVELSILGFGKPASGVIPNGFPGHFGEFRYEFNVSKAIEYLKRSGVQTPVKIRLLYQVDYDETRKFADVFRSMMADLGIIVEPEPQDWTRLKDIARGVWSDPENTPHLIVADWWPTIPSPYDYLLTMFHSQSKEWNFAGFENPEFDEIIDDAYNTEAVDYEKAMELYREAQKMIFKEAIAIGLWDEIRPFVYSSRVELPAEALNPMYMYVIRFELVKVR